MASFAVESDTLLDLEKLASVPPFCSYKVFQYKVSRSFEEECVVTAGSTFEAATKFAFWATDVGLLQSNLNEVSDKGTTVGLYFFWDHFGWELCNRAYDYAIGKLRR